MPFLSNCRNLLSPEGVLLIEVPEWGWVNHREPPAKGGHEPHTLFYSPSALLNHFEEAGLGVHYFKTLERIFECDKSGHVDLAAIIHDGYRI